jgi:hypothetical protein
MNLKLSEAILASMQEPVESVIENIQSFETWRENIFPKLYDLIPEVYIVASIKNDSLSHPFHDIRENLIQIAYSFESEEDTFFPGGDYIEKIKNSLEQLDNYFYELNILVENQDGVKVVDNKAYQNLTGDEKIVFNYFSSSWSYLLGQYYLDDVDSKLLNVTEDIERFHVTGLLQKMKHLRS